MSVLLTVYSVIDNELPSSVRLVAKLRCMLKFLSFSSLLYHSLFDMKYIQCWFSLAMELKSELQEHLWHSENWNSKLSQRLISLMETGSKNKNVSTSFSPLQTRFSELEAKVEQPANHSAKHFCFRLQKSRANFRCLAAFCMDSNQRES